MKYLTILFVLLPSITFGADVHIDITGIKSGVGQVVVRVWDSEDSYLVTAFATKTVAISKLDIDKVRVTFNEPLPVKCAINVYYDKNKNNELDTNWIGIPNEPVGITNNAKGHFGPPSYDDSKVTITGEEQTFLIQLKEI